MPSIGVQTTLEPSPKEGDRVARFLSLASAMRTDEDLTVLRRFGDLHMLQLLTLQFELDQLRRDFQETCAPSVPAYQAAPYNYLAPDPLRQEQLDMDKERSERQKAASRRELAATIKSKLKEYNEALIMESQIRNLETPDKSDIAYLRAWVSPELGGADLDDADRDCWSADYKDDFVSLRSADTKQNKILTHVNFWFQILYYKVWGYHQYSSSQLDASIIDLNKKRQRISKSMVQKRLAFSSRLVMALFGGIALIVPTVIMVIFPDRNTCMITTACATVIFALILAFGAQDSTGKDVLAATAAYTAVLVVFLGSSIGAG